MDIEWSKTIEEKALVKDALATPFSIPTSQGNVTAGQTEPTRNIDSDDVAAFCKTIGVLAIKSVQNVLCPVP